MNCPLSSFGPRRRRMRRRFVVFIITASGSGGRRLRRARALRRRLQVGLAIHPVVVVESGGAVIAFAAAFPYRSRDCYAGIAEFSVYVDPARRGEGAGRAALKGLLTACESAGFWKLLSRIFPENAASLALTRSLGFREVGLYEKHGKLEGVWRDVIIVEKLLPTPNA